MSWDPNKVCRTCLETDIPMISLFQESPVNSETLCVADMLKCFTSFDDIPDSQMPEMVCLSCIKEINRCYTFKIKCEVSSNSLKKLLGYINTEKNEELISNISSKDVDNYSEDLKTELMVEHHQELDDIEDEYDGLSEGIIEIKPKTNKFIKKSKTPNDPLKKKTNLYLELSSRDIKNIELINEVEKYHCIYDDYDTGYGSQPVRRRAWQKISRAVNLHETMCQRRWKQMRNHYVKLVNSGAIDTEKKCQWPLLNYIKFLNNHIRKKVEMSDNEDDPIPSTEEQLTAWQRSSIKLAQEVEKYKCLYDKDFGEYKDTRILRSKAWHEISLKMELDVKICQKRWKNIRDRYMAICRSASENGETDSNWHLFKYVQFLHKYLRQPSTRPKIRAEIPSDCEPIEVDVTEITYDTNF